MSGHSQWVYQQLQRKEAHLMVSHMGVFELVTLTTTGIVLSTRIDGALSSYGLIYCLWTIITLISLTSIADGIALVLAYRSTSPLRWMPHLRPWLIAAIGVLVPQFGVSVLLFLGLIFLYTDLLPSNELGAAISAGVSIYVGACIIVAGLAFLRNRYLGYI
ncbi:hypothetical protein GMRT_10607 [Giardia muris]|uniref:Uncharacterized protein n=1 Tax=Giardia muris TaxID=5742 RepID=A0A4Z1SMA0_GIAMU|nr:hypothetical protein GMRT_10607 [Giardia muris]|eukprot:TNJ26814.1 hypothetical protein GMRT_10607 [Giardia muris]